MTPPNVPLCRPLRRGMRGADVHAHKLAVHRWDPTTYTLPTYSDTFGDKLETAVKHFQHEHGIQATGRIGKATHEALERTHSAGSKTAWAFSPTAIQLASDFCREYIKTPDERVREQIVDAGFFWYTHRISIFYSRARPFQLGKPPWVPSRWDCSAFVTACHYAGGAPNPNDRPWDHQGYTGTLMLTGRVVGSISDLDPGDGVFYGYTTHASPAFPVGSPTHVALYVGRVNGVHSVLSMGSYPMRLLNYDYRSINHLRHYKVV